MNWSIFDQSPITLKVENMRVFFIKIDGDFDRDDLQQKLEENWRNEKLVTKFGGKYGPIFNWVMGKRKWRDVC